MNNLDKIFTKELINKRREYFSERKKFFTNNPEEQEKFIMKKGESDSNSLSNPFKHSKDIYNIYDQNNVYPLYKSSENKLFFISSKEKTDSFPSKNDLDKYFEIKIDNYTKLYFDIILLRPMYLVISRPDKKFNVPTSSLRNIEHFDMELFINDEHVIAIMNFTFVVHDNIIVHKKMDQEIPNIFMLPSLHYNAEMASC